MYEKRLLPWPAASHAIETVDLAAIKLAVALAFPLFTEAFLLDFSTGRVCVSYASDVPGVCVMITPALKSYRDLVGFLTGSAWHDIFLLPHLQVLTRLECPP